MGEAEGAARAEEGDIERIDHSTVALPGNPFGNAGRNLLRGPAFAQLDLALRKRFQLSEGTKITFGAEAFNLLNHPNFAVPSNTQSPLTQRETGMLFLRMRRAILPIILAGYSPPSAVRAPDSACCTIGLLTAKTPAVGA
jgi:hypothetical protein